MQVLSPVSSGVSVERPSSARHTRQVPSSSGNMSNLNKSIWVSMKKFTKEKTNNFAHYDTFGETPMMNLGKGIGKVGTKIGAIVTILLFLSLIWYAW